MASAGWFLELLPRRPLTRSSFELLSGPANHACPLARGRESLGAAVLRRNSLPPFPQSDSATVRAGGARRLARGWCGARVA